MLGTSTTYRASDHQGWAGAKLRDFAEFSDGVEYRNERESGWDDLEGDWFHGDDEASVLYFGSHGNDHSPGSDSYTWAEVFERPEDYRAALKEWEDAPEFIDDEDAEDSET